MTRSNGNALADGQLRRVQANATKPQAARTRRAGGCVDAALAQRDGWLAPIRRLAKRQLPIERPRVARRYAELPATFKPLAWDLLGGRARWPLLLWGDVDTGKTCAGLWLCDVVGPCCWCATIENLLEGLLASKQGEYNDELRVLRGTQAFWREWEQAKLTVLDELGLRQNPSDFEYTTLMRALDLRQGKPCVFISNHPPAELGGRYDVRAESRLAQGTVLQLARDTRDSKVQS